MQRPSSFRLHQKRGVRHAFHPVLSPPACRRRHACVNRSGGGGGRTDLDKFVWFGSTWIYDDDDENSSLYPDHGSITWLIGVHKGQISAGTNLAIEKFFLPPYITCLNLAPQRGSDPSCPTRVLVSCVVRIVDDKRVWPAFYETRNVQMVVGLDLNQYENRNLIRNSGGRCKLESFGRLLRRNQSKYKLPL